MVAIIPRERLDGVWAEHIAFVTNPRIAKRVENFQKEVQMITDSIALNKRVLVEMTKRLFDDGWIKQNHPLWGGIRIVRSNKKLDNNAFLLLVRRNLERVEKVDQYLAPMIKGEFAKRGSVERLPVLDELRTIVKNKKPLEAVHYILENSERLTNELANLREKERYEEIQRVMERIKIRYYSLLELNGYLIQWRDNINQNRGYLGLITQKINEFIIDLEKRNLSDLAIRVEESNPIKNLRCLSEEIKYLGDSVYIGRDKKKRMGILLKIMLGEKEDNWDHFNEFYDNLKREEHEIIELFGDQDVVDELVDFKKTKHKWLVGWKNKIKEIIARLSSPEHQLQVIGKAIESLRLILEGYMKERKEDSSRELKSMLHVLLVLVKERGKPLSKKKILSICRLREKSLREGVKKVRSIFKKEEESLSKLDQEIKEEEGRLQEADRSLEYVSSIIRSEASKKELVRYSFGNIAMLDGDIVRNSDLISNALGGLSQLEDNEKEIRLNEIKLIRDIDENVVQKNGSVDKLVIKLREYSEGLILLNNFLKKSLMLEQIMKERKPQEVKEVSMYG